MLKQLISTVTKLAGSRKAVASTAGSGGAVTLGGVVFALLVNYTSLDQEIALTASGLIAAAIMYGVGSFVKAQGVADAGDENYGLSKAEKTAKIAEGDKDMLDRLLSSKENQ